MQFQNWEARVSVTRPKIHFQYSLIYIAMSLGVLGAIGWTPSAAAQGAMLSPPSAWSMGVITGSVYRDGSHPAGQVAVEVQSATQQIYRTVLTDQEGHFEVRGLPSGIYDISVAEPGCDSERTSARVDGTMSTVVLRIRSRRPKDSPGGSASSVSVHELKVPDKARDEYEKGMASNAKNQFAESLEHLQKATELFPNYYEAETQLGVAKMGLGNYDEALEEFQNAINSSDGRYALAAFGMGYTWYLQGKLTEAESMLRRGLEIDPDSVNGYFCLGMTLFRLKRLDEAEKNGREALRRKADFAPAYIILANVYGQRRQFHEQLDALESYLKLSPEGASSQKVREARQITRAIIAEGKDR